MTARRSEQRKTPKRKPWEGWLCLSPLGLTECDVRYHEWHEGNELPPIYVRQVVPPKVKRKR